MQDYTAILVERGWVRRAALETPSPAPPPKAFAEGVSRVATTCWHCRGEKRCACITCWKGGPGECAACKGTGQVLRWVQ